MDELTNNERLSRIETLWSVVNHAHDSDSPTSDQAKQALLNRYSNAIRRYLGAAVKQPDIANDLFQEFAVKFLKGDFRSVDPVRGRFRSFVKTVLFRMVAHHFRKQASDRIVQVEELPDPESSPESDRSETEFINAWRSGLLDRAWQAIEKEQEAGGPKHHTILRIRAEHPLADFQTIASYLEQKLRKKISPGNARVMVHRARSKFAQHLVQQVANSLNRANAENLEQELIELKLIDYCKEHLDNLKKQEKSDSDV
ncbi:MAG: sigma-70 family RNA polymerase sigma factor [Planctomycetota bacterium]